jgi:hypothetical protein
MNPNTRILLIAEIVICGGLITVAGMLLVALVFMLAITEASEGGFFLLVPLVLLVLAGSFSIFQYWSLAICTIRNKKYRFGVFYYLALLSVIVSSISLAFFMPPLLFLVALVTISAAKLIRIQTSDNF